MLPMCTCVVAWNKNICASIPNGLALCVHVYISIWLCLLQLKPINTTLAFLWFNPGLPCLTSIYPRATITLPQAVWECHTEDDKTEIWMCTLCVFIGMQMWLPRSPTCLNRNLACATMIAVFGGRKEEKENLNTHGLEPDLAISSPSFNFGTVRLTFRDEYRMLCWHTGIPSCAAGAMCLDYEYQIRSSEIHVH